MLHYIIIGAFIAFIIVVQIWSFSSNLKRMQMFKNTFGIPNSKKTQSFYISKDTTTNYVNGVIFRGKKNAILERILASINKYLANNRANVIDFQLLKDTVDRNCDSVEEDINTQTPIPLYLGLAGTMFGIIVGIGFMWLTGSLNALLQQGSESAGLAADGIATLLSCVAVAMLASIVGLSLTTYCSFYFKSCKLQLEEQKSDFLTWMQANLLPALSVDSSDTLMHLTMNLMRFNETFAQNTTNLKKVFDGVNVSYDKQAEIIENIRNMNFHQMAQANVTVLKQLEQSTQKLEDFNKYLLAIRGYTDTIQKFNEQFHNEESRLGVLVEIRDFFRSEFTQINQRKAEMAKAISNVDDELRKSLSSLSEGVENSKGDLSKSVSDVNDILIDSLKELKDYSQLQLDEIKKTLGEQAQQFKFFIDEQQRAFQRMNSDMQGEFKAQLATMPQTSRQLATIGTLPQQMKEIAGMIIQSNEIMANRVATVVSGNDVDVNGKRKKSFLDYLKYICVAIGFASLLIIAINNLLELLG